MRLTVDLIIILATWLTVFPLHRSMARPVELSWAQHVVWAIPLMAGWMLLVRLDRRLVNRTSHAAYSSLVRSMPAMALMPCCANAFDVRRTVPLALMILWALAALALFFAGRLAFADRSAPSDIDQTQEGRLGLRSLLMGLIVLACVPLFPSIAHVYSPAGRDYLLSFLRGVVQLAGLILVAIAVGITLSVSLNRIRIAVLSVRRSILLAILGLLSATAAAAFAYVVLGHMPHVQDEIALLFQAKNFAAGRLHAPVPPMIEAFDAEFIVVDGSRWYGKYTPGSSLLLVPGVWTGATWLVHPILSIVALMLLFVLAKRLLGERQGRLVAILAVLSPFWLLTFASQMSHPACLTTMLLFAVCVLAAAGRAGRWYHAGLAGLILAMGIGVRPYTAVVLAVPWRIYALVVTVRNRAWWRPVPCFALGLVVGILPLLAYNKALTGDPFLLPFTKAAPKDRLGFGPDIGMEYVRADRRGHDLSKGLRLLGLQVDALGRDLMGWPRGVLLLAVIGGWRAARRWNGRFLLVPAVVLPAAFVFYWFDGVCYGPRYYSEALPVYLMLVVLGLEWLRRSIRGFMRRRQLAQPTHYATASVWAAILMLSLGYAAIKVPRLVGDFRTAYWGTDSAVRHAVERDRPHKAIVFVQSSHYRSTKGGQFAPDYYGAAFWMNSPTLDDDVIFARDLDQEIDRKMPPGSNRRVLGAFPGRVGYRFVRDDADRGRLVPLDSEPPRR